MYVLRELSANNLLTSWVFRLRSNFYFIFWLLPTFDTVYTFVFRCCSPLGSCRFSSCNRSYGRSLVPSVSLECVPLSQSSVRPFVSGPYTSMTTRRVSSSRFRYGYRSLVSSFCFDRPCAFVLSLLFVREGRNKYQEDIKKPMCLVGSYRSRFRPIPKYCGSVHYLVLPLFPKTDGYTKGEPNDRSLIDTGLDSWMNFNLLLL